MLGVGLSFARGRIARSFGCPDTGFHADRVLQQLVRDLIRSGSVTSFVETGTYLGETTLCVSRMDPGLPVFTCEVNERLHRIARRRLAGRANALAVHAASRDFLPGLIERRACGDRPLFLLDAHWYDDWPLVEEIRIITKRLAKCLIIIDDFMVPGEPQFQYDIGGGGGKAFSGRSTVDHRPCDLDLIAPSFDPGKKIRIFFPRYSRTDAFPRCSFASRLFPLRGYAIVFWGRENNAMLLAPLVRSKYHFQHRIS